MAGENKPKNLYKKISGFRDDKEGNYQRMINELCNIYEIRDKSKLFRVLIQEAYEAKIDA